MPDPRAWRIYDGIYFKAQIQFEPKDCWIGVFWRVTERRDGAFVARRHRYLHLYVCILPLLPLHVTAYIGERDV